MNNDEMSSIFSRILDPSVLGWAPNHFILGAQLASGQKLLVCIPAMVSEEKFSLYKPVLNIWPQTHWSM